MENINFDLNSIVYILGAISALIASGAVIYKFFRKSTSKIIRHNAETVVEEKMDEIEDNLSKSIQDLHNDLNSMQEDLNKHIAKSESDMADVKKTLCDEVREKITRIHNECIKAGMITQHQLYIVEELYEDYSERLNGNSFVDTLVEDLRDLYKNQDLDI